LNLRTTNKAQKVIEGFELDVHRVQIPAYSHHYAVVSFTPAAMQSYSVIFEVSVDGVPRGNRETRVAPNLSFEVHGEGHLPRVNIARPAVRNKKAQAMMLFNKLLLGRQATQTLLLLNDGVLPAKVNRSILRVEQFEK
jgi:hydrocephalus-inducing protein